MRFSFTTLSYVGVIARSTFSSGPSDLYIYIVVFDVTLSDTW